MIDEDRRDPLGLVVLAVEQKERGRLAEAHLLLQEALLIDPQFGPAHFERGVLHANAGDHIDAVAAFRRALLAQPGDMRYAFQMGISAAMIGSKPFVEAALAEMPNNDEAQYLSTKIDQFFRYIDNQPLKEVLLRLNLLESKHSYLNVIQLKEEIINAVRNFMPLSFIRLGDGEGTRVPLDSIDQVRYWSLYASSRQKLLDIWFAGRVGEKAQFDNLDLTLKDVVRRADIIGIPYRSWIEHEYKIASISGITSLSNLVSFIDSNADRRSHLCAQNIHFLLGQSDFFPSLFNFSRKFVVISCHSNIPDSLKSKFGVLNVELIKIPAEGAYRNVIGDANDDRIHFPDVFTETIEYLNSHDLSESIFLIAAGFLGKFYCDAIKTSGGVAIDIGSVADAWMGKVTRPGMENISAL